MRMLNLDTVINPSQLQMISFWQTKNIIILLLHTSTKYLIRTCGEPVTKGILLFKKFGHSKRWVVALAPVSDKHDFYQSAGT